MMRRSESDPGRSCVSLEFSDGQCLQIWVICCSRIQALKPYTLTLDGTPQISTMNVNR